MAKKTWTRFTFVALSLIVMLMGCAAPSEQAAIQAEKQAQSNQGGTGSAGASQPAQQPAAQPSAPAAKELKLVKLAVPHTTLFDVAVPVYVAEEKGFFEEAGIRVETTFTKGGGDTVQTIISGSADIGLATGPQSIVAAYDRGAPLKIISSQMTGFDIYWLVKADSPYHNYKDLAGKKIGFSSVGSSTDAAVQILNGMLERDNLTKMEGLPIGSPPDQITAVLTGQIDAGFASAPSGFREVDEGKLRIAILGSDITDYANISVRVNFANAKFFNDNPDTVKAFLEALHKSLKFMHENKEETVAIWKKRADLKEEEAILLKTFDIYTPQMQRLAPLDGIDAIIEDSVKFDYIDQPLPDDKIKDLFDVRFAPVMN